MAFDESSSPPLSAVDVIIPEWPHVPRVRALFTTRAGGVSAPPYGQWRNGHALPGGLNLAFHTGDNPQCVTENRARLAAFTGTRGSRSRTADYRRCEKRDLSRQAAHVRYAIVHKSARGHRQPALQRGRAR